jgi:hypothetical protein
VIFPPWFFSGRILTMTMTHVPLDVDFAVARLRDSARQDLCHRTLVMRHECTVGTVHFVRAAEALVGIPWLRCATPQFRSARVEVSDHARIIAGIDGDGTQREKHTIALFTLAQSCFGAHALRDFVYQLLVESFGDPAGRKRVFHHVEGGAARILNLGVYLLNLGQTRGDVGICLSQPLSAVKH